MTLQDYMDQTGIRGASLAKQLGVSSQAVSKWRRGSRIPRAQVMKKISEITDGAVTAADFYASVDA